MKLKSTQLAQNIEAFIFFMLLMTEEKLTSDRLLVFNETSDDGRSRTCVLSQQHNTVRHLQTCGKWRSASDSETSYKDSVYLQLSIAIKPFLAFRVGGKSPKERRRPRKTDCRPKNKVLVFLQWSPFLRSNNVIEATSFTSTHCTSCGMARRTVGCPKVLTQF